MIGSLLANRYRLVKKLSSGNMAQTYLAEDIQAEGLKQVVKQLKPTNDELNLLERNKQLFEAEAKALEELGSHDQIPCLWSYFEEDTEFYLVQEWIEGVGLEQEIAIGQRWTESQVIEFLQEMLTLLTFVHGYNVIHRDIKPANIIRRHRDGQLVLIDFGAVKQVQVKQPKLSGQTSVAVIIGTPGYMPSEQANGKPHFSSDIYALGMVAIQALTGLLPKQLREDENGELIWQAQAEVSDDLANILTKMVRQYFKHRYQTASEALVAIQALSVNSPSDLGSRVLSAGSEPTAPLSDQSSADPPLDEGDPSINGLSSVVSSQQHTIPVMPEEAKRQVSLMKASGSSIAPRSRRLITAGAIALLLSSLSGIGYLVHAKSMQDHRQTLERLQQLAQEGLYERCVAEAKALPTMNQTLTTQGEALLETCQTGQEQALALQDLRALEDENDYEACIKAGQAFPGPETEQSLDAMGVLSRCRQRFAAQLVRDGRYVAAIKVATEIALEAPNYSEAQTLISQWSYRILELAEEKYQKEGDLQAAKAFVNAIPDGVAGHIPAQRKLPNWTLELKTNKTLVQQAQSSLDKGQWRDAIHHASQVTTAYFKAQAAPIINKANEELRKVQTRLTTIRTPLLDVQDALGINSPELSRSGTRYHEYTFEGESGKTISIMMESEDFDPYLYLAGPDGELVATNDDLPNGDYNSAINIPLTQTGTYRIQATAYSPDDRGRYRLVVRYLPE